MRGYPSEHHYLELFLYLSLSFFLHLSFSLPLSHPLHSHHRAAILPLEAENLPSDNLNQPFPSARLQLTPSPTLSTYPTLYLPEGFEVRVTACFERKGYGNSFEKVVDCDADGEASRALKRGCVGGGGSA